MQINQVLSQIHFYFNLFPVSIDIFTLSNKFLNIISNEQIYKSIENNYSILLSETQSFDHLNKQIMSSFSIFIRVVIIKESVNECGSMFTTVSDIQINVLRCDVIESCDEDSLIVVETHLVR